MRSAAARRSRFILAVAVLFKISPPEYSSIPGFEDLLIKVLLRPPVLMGNPPKAKSKSKGKN